MKAVSTAGPGVKLVQLYSTGATNNYTGSVWPEGGEGPQAPSSKLQAPLTMDHGSRRMNLEREEKMEVEQLKRIADAIEEILRIVKKDMEPKK